MPANQKIAICLWFDDQAEEAANYYASIFPDSQIGDISRYGEAGREIHGKQPGAVMTVSFELNGLKFTALNGGPLFHFSEAVSIQIYCETQDEVDHYWDKLTAGGDSAAQQCGWLKDRYGVSWQIIPTILPALLGGDDAVKSQRAVAAMMQMKKLDIDALKQAYGG